MTKSIAAATDHRSETLAKGSRCAKPLHGGPFVVRARRLLLPHYWPLFALIFPTYTQAGQQVHQHEQVKNIVIAQCDQGPVVGPAPLQEGNVVGFT